VYRASNDADMDKFNKFANFQLEAIKMDQLDRTGVLNAFCEGMAIYHFYWDKELKGLKANTKGSVSCEMIKPLNIIVANPNEKDIQKQAWVMFYFRKTLSSILEICDKDIKKDDLIEVESSLSPYKEIEQDNEKMVNVFLRYFRSEGNVYYEMATEKCLFLSARPLKSDFEAELNKKKAEDPENASLPELELKYAKYKNITWDLYPICIWRWEERVNSFYGLSEVEGMIPNQKTINWDYALYQKGIMDRIIVSYGVKRGSLGDQEITNQSGKIYELSNVDDIRPIATPAIPSDIINFADNVIRNTRSIVGATEVMTGETKGANASGIQIQLLQNQAKEGVSDKQGRFLSAKKEVGKVLEYFFKNYYEDALFIYEDIQNKGLKEDTFNGSEYLESNIMINAEIGASSKFSDMTDIQILQDLKATNVLSPKDFVKALPDSAIGNKQKLLEILNASEESQMKQLGEQIAQLQQTVEQYKTYIKDNKEVLESGNQIVQENIKLNNVIELLQKEYIDKINSFNEIISTLDKELKSTKADALLGATLLNDKNASQKA
jgi:hypothetical protein